MSTDYIQLHRNLQSTLGELSRELRGPVAGFVHLHKESVAPGALTPKAKELMALAIAVASRCEDCVAYHVHDAHAAGASRAEILETLGVAIMMGGGPALMYACEAFNALEQFEHATPTSP